MKYFDRADNIDNLVGVSKCHIQLCFTVYIKDGVEIAFQGEEMYCRNTR